MRSFFRKKLVVGTAILPLLIVCFAFLPQVVQAASVPTTISSITTTSTPLSSQACALVKKALPNKSADPQICMITHIHRMVTTQISQVSSTQPFLPTNCSAHGSVATAYDQLKYSFIWAAELDTEYQYHQQHCTPSLLYSNGYMLYTLNGTTGSQSTSVNTVNHTVTVIQSIDTATLGVGMHSCQERGANGDAFSWPYNSVFYAGCVPFS